MTYEANHFTIADFENISIDSLLKRGLRFDVKKALKSKGITRIEGLKGKSSKELPSVEGVDDLGEILCIIGIEYKLDPEYFLKYPFISQENEAIAEMRKNPLKIPLRRIGIDSRISNALLRRKQIGIIQDLIGKKRDELHRIHGMGTKGVSDLVNALYNYNVKIIDGKFYLDLNKDQNENICIKPGSEDTTYTDNTAVNQLRELFKLSGEVAGLPIKAIEQANAALMGILTQYRGRGDLTDG